MHQYLLATSALVLLLERIVPSLEHDASEGGLFEVGFLELTWHLDALTEVQCVGKILVICKKVFSVSLVFNALLTIVCLVSVLSGYYYYYHDWEPFAPYLLSGHLLWVAIAAAVINIFPSAALGRSLHTGRFLFHHYIYGFIALAVAIAYVVIFVPVPLWKLFFVDNTTVQVNLGRFFILGGAALVIDDLTDVSAHLEKGLNRLKFHIGQQGKFVSALQLVCGVISLYIFGAITLSIVFTPGWFTVANVLVDVTGFITAVTSLVFVRRRVWQKINHTSATVH